MGRIIKAAILAWFGKKIYDYAQHREEPAKTAKATPHRKRAKKTAAHA